MVGGGCLAPNVWNVRTTHSVGHHHPKQSSTAPAWSSRDGCDGVGGPASAPEARLLPGLSMQGSDVITVPITASQARAWFIFSHANDHRMGPPNGGP